MQIIDAPNKYQVNANENIIFLAGSIDQGKAIEWQNELINILKNIEAFNNSIVLNPRRKDWDASWAQTLEDERFVEQVEWELDGLEKADLIFLVFDEQGQAPISLLEMGLNAKHNKLIVCCPEEFWRSGNVYITCRKYGIPYVKNFEELKDKLKNIKNL